MIPVMQTIFRSEHEQPGNCVQACVASLLELPLEAVPHFFKDADESNYHKGWFLFDEWFGQFGIYPRHVDLSSSTGCAWDFPHLAAGPSPRGIEHQVIRKGFEIIHDPHPDGGGVDPVREVTDLIVMDPTKLHLLHELRRAS